MVMSNAGNKQITWEGEIDRPLQLRRPCSCGCDGRDGDVGVGYITGSDGRGRGFTVWIEDEDVYKRMEEILKAFRASAALQNWRKGEEMIDKYAVVTNPPSGEKTASDAAVCPSCGSPLEKGSNVPKCPKCGTAPFENQEAPDDEEEKEQP